MNRNFSLIAAFLFALTLGMTGTSSFTASQAAPVQSAQPGAAAPTSAAEAQQELARFSTANLGRIKDEKVRAAVQRALTALQAIANNRDQRKEAALIQAYETSLANVKKEADQSAAYQTNTFKCNQDRLECKKQCQGSGKKLCGCGAAFLGCLVFG
jgi:hypothetical protein